MSKHLSFLGPSQNLDIMVVLASPVLEWAEIGGSLELRGEVEQKPAFKSKVKDNYALTSQIALWPLQNTCSYTHMNAHTHTKN